MFRVRRIAFFITAAAAAVAALFGAAPAYRACVIPVRNAWLVSSAIRSGAALAARGEDTLAEAKYHGALRRCPDSAELLRAYAEFLDSRGRPDALSIWAALRRLQPESWDVTLEAAECALRFDAYADAGHFLDTLPVGASETPKAARLRGTLAARRGDLVAAEAHFADALRLQPGNPIHAANLHAIRIRSSDPVKATEADAALAGITGPPAILTFVLSTRLEFAMRAEGDERTAERLAGELERLGDWADPSATTLLTYYALKMPEKLASAVAAAFADPVTRRVVGPRWLAWASARRAFAAGDMILALAGPDLASRSDFVLKEAEYCVLKADDASLRKCLDKPGWKSMPAMHDAYRIWLARESPTARAEIAAQAAESAARDLHGAFIAAATLEKWGFQREAAAVWVSLGASDHPAAPIARSRLLAAVKAGQSESFTAMIRLKAKRNRADYDARAKAVYLDLIEGGYSPKLLKEAADLFGARPDNPTILALHAYCSWKFSGADPRSALGDLDPMAFAGLGEAILAGEMFLETDPALAEKLLAAPVRRIELPSEKTLRESLLNRLHPPTDKSKSSN